MRDARTKGRFPIGSQLPNAKLSEEKVRDLRERYARREIGSAGIVQETGLGKSTVFSILSGKTWKHVPMPDILKSKPKYSKKWTIA